MKNNTTETAEKRVVVHVLVNNLTYAFWLKYHVNDEKQKL